MPPSEEMNLKRGPWTLEEDLVLMNYIAANGEGKWNSLARCAGLWRTGKSCRLRWLNYLSPGVRRGNITPEEQLLILELHSRWGNRWSKIAQHLPGRTDNEIKNYYRTRVQKHAKQLGCGVGSNQFNEAMRQLWIPRLLERIRAASCETLAPAGEKYPIPWSCIGDAPDLARQVKVSPENSSAAGSSVESFGVMQQLSVLPAVSGGGGDVMEPGDLWSESVLPLLSPGGGEAVLGMPDLDETAWGESLCSVESGCTNSSKEENCINNRVKTNVYLNYYYYYFHDFDR